jgi:hypothetical protein
MLTHESEIEGYKIVIKSLKDGIERELDEHRRTRKRLQTMSDMYWAMKKETEEALPLAHFVIDQHVKQMARELFAIRNRRNW